MLDRSHGALGGAEDTVQQRGETAPVGQNRARDSTGPCGSAEHDGLDSATARSSAERSVRSSPDGGAVGRPQRDSEATLRNSQDDPRHLAGAKTELAPANDRAALAAPSGALLHAQLAAFEPRTRRLAAALVAVIRSAAGARDGGGGGREEVASVKQAVRDLARVCEESGERDLVRQCCERTGAGSLADVYRATGELQILAEYLWGDDEGDSEYGDWTGAC